ncbi:MAG: LCP family protein [Oscillospiraceae bacterium]|nr:LCP family protein [Oscillospiraceae bacterium]
MKKRLRAKDIAFAALMLILVLVMLYSGLRIVESTVLYSGEPEEFVSKTITRDGVDYFPRQDITTVLVMGIDRFGPVESSESYQNRGASDMNMLLIFDEVNEVCNVLHLNRDTMLEMPVLGIGGKEAGTFYGQLALSHTYGSGLEDSCENTRNTISAFLYGITIDYYVAMNMDAIAVLNDAVGGVNVNVTEDFSRVDPTIGMGAVTLKGEQAIHFVRTRKDVGDQLNLSRIQRQQDYIDGFTEAFRAKQADEQFILSVYEEVAPYIVTDCSMTVINSMVSRYGDYAIGEVVTPPGENVLGEEYYEFYADEEALDALILRLLYAPKG